MLDSSPVGSVVFGDKRAVSPVIGVVLMVAITVILAAVIGAFVLGLGGEQHKAPQASFDIDFVDGEVTIRHESGDALPKDSIDVLVDGSSRGNSALSSAGDDETYTAGEMIYTGEIKSGDEIRIIWRSPTGETTTTLSHTTAP